MTSKEPKKIVSKILKCEETGNFYEFKFLSDGYRHIRITKKDFCGTSDWIKYEDIKIKFICNSQLGNTDYVTLKTKLQCYDGDYLEVETMCKELCFHLDKVELETYWFPDDITDVKQLVSKRCFVDINSYIECKRINNIKEL